METVLSHIDNLDLTRLHGVLAMMGALLAIYVMALTSYEHEDRCDPVIVQWSRRASLAMVALGFLWSLSYSESKRWEPWPPEILLMMGTIGVLLVRGLAIHLRIRREGRHRPIGDAVPQRHRGAFRFLDHL